MRCSLIKCGDCLLITGTPSCLMDKPLAFSIHKKNEARGTTFPKLFVLVAEVLSRALNDIYDNALYRGYGLSR